jgi:hypothetical protein
MKILKKTCRKWLLINSLSNQERQEMLKSMQLTCVIRLAFNAWPIDFPG